jgi:endonuclease-3
MNMKEKQKRAIKQLMEIKKLAKEIRLAADGWDEDWKTLIATLMSARTTDKITISIAERLFEKYDSVNKLAKAKANEISKVIRGVNFYKTKARNVSSLAKILVNKYKGKVPYNFDKLIELPGIGRKTANVFLAEKGFDAVGVDTHLSYCAQRLGWSKQKEQHKIEIDLENLFPKHLLGDLNWIVVRFGQTYTNRKVKNQILDRIKRIK